MPMLYRNYISAQSNIFNNSSEKNKTYITSTLLLSNTNYNFINYINFKGEIAKYTLFVLSLFMVSIDYYSFTCLITSIVFTTYTDLNLFMILYNYHIYFAKPFSYIRIALYIYDMINLIKLILIFTWYKLTPVFIIVVLNCEVILTYGAKPGTMLLSILSLFTCICLLFAEYKITDKNSFLQKIKNIFSNKKTLLFIISFIVFSFAVRQVIIQSMFELESRSIILTANLIIATFIPITWVYKRLINYTFSIFNVTYGEQEKYHNIFLEISNLVNPSNFIYTILIVLVWTTFKDYALFMIFTFITPMLIEYLSNLKIDTGNWLKMEGFNSRGENYSNFISSTGEWINKTINPDNIKLLNFDIQADDTHSCDLSSENALSNTNHSNTTNYCPIGKTKIEIRANEKNINPSELENEMKNKSVHCRHICRNLEFDDNGYVSTTKYPFDSKILNSNTDIKNLCKSLMSAITNCLIVRTPEIGINSNGEFDKMLSIPLNVSMGDIKQYLDNEEIELLMECVSRKPSLYRLEILDNNIPDDVKIVDRFYGCRLVNLISMFGSLSEAEIDEKLGLRVRPFVLLGQSFMDRTKIYMTKTISELNPSNSLLSRIVDPCNHTPHDPELGLCPAAKLVVAHSATFLRITPHSLEKRLEMSDSTCRDIFQKPIPNNSNGIPITTSDHLDLNPRNPNNDVANLAEKLTSILIKQALYPRIRTSPSPNSCTISAARNRILFRDIKNHLTTHDIILLHRCVNANINMYGGSFTDDSIVFSKSKGFYLPNTINKHGLISFRSWSTRLDATTRPSRSRSPILNATTWPSRSTR